MMAASNRFSDAADRVAASSAEGGDSDLVTATTDMVQARHAFAANAKVIRFADELWDALLQIQPR